MRILLAVCLASLSACADAQYSDDMYAQAINESSTAPLFVLVTLRGTDGNLDQVTCVEAPHLLGAIHREHKLAYDAAGVRTAAAIALETPTHQFSFTTPDAQRNVFPIYGVNDLTRVKQALASKTDAQLRREIREYRSPIHQMYQDHPTFGEKVKSLYAICHVLLERGILVGRTDRALGLYLAR